LGLFLSVAVLPQAPAVEISTRIIGGHPAQDGAWPWMVALLQSAVADRYFAQFCGASLIDDDWVLTAAHCVTDDNGFPRSASEIDVLAGQNDLSGTGGQRIRAQRIVVHPNYDIFTLANDIALIKLSAPLNIEPVRLPGMTFDNPIFPPGMLTTAIGWGSLNPAGTIYPDDLQQVDLPIVSNMTCQEAFPVFPIFDTMLCAGFPQGGKDTCVGDSGGPLVGSSGVTRGTWTQVGVTSFGTQCAQAGTYGVYTRVSRYGPWITGNICSASEIPPSPVIQLAVNGNVASVSFDPVPNATGYRLYWAPYPGQAPISQWDMGSSTTFSTPLPNGSQFYVAVQPYNGNCLGGFSNIDTVFVPGS
jgi:secreted trypsin-like serine protease